MVNEIVQDTRIATNCAFKQSSHDNQGKEYVERLIKDTWLYDHRLGQDSVGLTHSSIKVKKIFRLCNNLLWNNYNQTVNTFTLLSFSTFPNELIQNPIATTYYNKCIYVTNSEKFNIPLRQNEVHLFHGTQFSNIFGIAQKGFDLKMAKPGLYGKALYMAESSEKADQYAGMYIVIFDVF